MEERNGVTAARAALVIDDEEMIRSVLGMLVTSMGFEVDQAADGQEALQRLSRRDYDLVLCDLLMPGMRGDELHRICQQENPQAASRFVFLSGCAAGDAVADLASSSGQPCLVKHRISDVETAIAQIA